MGWPGPVQDSPDSNAEEPDSKAYGSVSGLTARERKRVVLPSRAARTWSRVAPVAPVRTGGCALNRLPTEREWGPPADAAIRATVLASPEITTRSPWCAPRGVRHGVSDHPGPVVAGVHDDITVPWGKNQVTTRGGTG